MKAVTGTNDKPQRRIIIENEHLVALFDLLAAGVSLERDSFPVPIEFGEEEMVEISSMVEDICEAVIGRISKNPLYTLLKDKKTFELGVRDEVVGAAIDTFITENVDDLTGIVVSALHTVMTDAIKQIVDELIREAELFNMKRLVIKTRKHALVFC